MVPSQIGAVMFFWLDPVLCEFSHIQAIILGMNVAKMLKNCDQTVAVPSQKYAYARGVVGFPPYFSGFALLKTCILASNTGGRKIFGN